MNFFTKLINSLQTFAQNIRFSRTSPAPVSIETEVIEPEISDSPIEIIQQVIEEAKEFLKKLFNQTVEASNKATAIAVWLVGGVMLGYYAGHIAQLIIITTPILVCLGLAILWTGIKISLYGFALVLIVDIIKSDIQSLKNDIQAVL